MKSTLIIWVPSQGGSATLAFEGVEFVEEFIGRISFTYDGISTGQRRKATFRIDRIMGWSLATTEADK